MSAGWRRPPWKTSRWQRKSAARSCTTTSPTRTNSCRRSSTTKPTPSSITSGTRSAARTESKPGGSMVITAARRTKAKGGLRTWFARWSTRRERPRGPSPHRGRVRSVGSRHQRWTAIPSCRRETPVRHRPGRPRHYSARHAPRRASTRPGATEYPPVRNCGRYPPRPYHRQMSPSRIPLTTTSAATPPPSAFRNPDAGVSRWWDSESWLAVTRAHGEADGVFAQTA